MSKKKKEEVVKEPQEEKDPVLLKQEEIVNKRKEQLKEKEESTKEPEKEPEKELEEPESKGAEKTEEEEALLNTEDSELSEEERKNKQEVKERIEKMDKKVEDRKSEIQKEIDALKAQQKSVEESVGKLAEAQKVIDRLEEAIVELTEGKKAENQETQKKETKSTIKEKAVQLQKDRIEKYINEDKDKPYEERMEMSEEELDEFALENPRKYGEWVSQRDFRRRDEKVEDLKRLEEEHKPKEPEFDKKKYDAEVEASLKNLFTALPGLEPFFGPGEEKDKHRKENAEDKDFLLFNKIVKDNPDFLKVSNGPELVLAEMQKSPEVKPEDKKTYTEEEVAKMKEDAVKEALESEGDQGITSTRSKEIPTSGRKIVMTGKEYATWKKAFPRLSDKEIGEKFQFIKERRRGIPGANVFKEAPMEKEVILGV